MQAKCLTEQEMVAAVARMKLDAHGPSSKSNVESRRLDWKWARMVVLNWNTYVALGVAFAQSLSLSLDLNWAPLPECHILKHATQFKS